MNKLRYIFFMFVLHSSNAISETLDDVDYAFRICTVVERTGMAIDCAVNTFSVDITIDTNGSEGKKICEDLAKFMSTQTDVFKKTHWQIKIISPYSNGTPIAKCKLK